MKNLVPHIFRQRLLIEGLYSTQVDKAAIKRYFKTITKSLKFRTYGKPIIHRTGGIGKKINQGHDAFVPLIDSGISLYTWSNDDFVSIIIYTCKKFDVRKAIKTTKGFFGIKKFVFKVF
ncbi:S-adenosylmethionine decarboxylase [Elusimicrobiota bacterium]